MITAVALPHWDMTVVYPSLESPEFEAGMQAAVQGIAALEALFDAHHVAQSEHAPLTDAVVAGFEEVTTRYNELVTEVGTLGSYIYAFVSTNSRDDMAQARLSELDNHTVLLSQLGTRYTAWIGSLDVEALIERSPLAADHAFALRKAWLEARHLMSPAEEDLAATLNLTGGGAWGKLHNNLTSQLVAPVDLHGEVRDLPMSMVRNLAFDADREVRRRAYEAELAAWQRVETPLAAAMNSIKGQVGALATRRGWAAPLDEALADNNIDRATLDAMLDAARASFPQFRRYLKAKARALGLPALAWYDMFAPLDADGAVWEFEQGAQFIEEQFGAYSPRLRDFAARAFRERWVDAEPRAGKRDGAYCMSLRRDESRVFMNYKPVYTSVSTLAHELGHGYHNLNLAHRTPLQSQTPMALAETASIFCETIISQAALKTAGPRAQVAILEESLQGNCQVVVDITSRFLLESRIFEGRPNREFSVGELKEMMLAAQRETYGDGLDNDLLHPYMWAMKPHYYSAGRSFYNWPYMFGLLFGLGLYALYQRDPEAFIGRYDDLLSSTGLADAATLASRFDIDIRSPEFWHASLEIIGQDVERFEAATAR